MMISKNCRQTIFYRKEMVQMPPPETRQLEFKEKRAAARIFSHVPIVFSHFSTKNYLEHRSMTFNHSSDGMCFESPEALSPGAILYIRTAPTPADKIYHSSREGLRHTTLAEVRWCRQSADDFGSYYSVGVKYY
jgi:hypothetical protein